MWMLSGPALVENINLRSLLPPGVRDNAPLEAGEGKHNFIACKTITCTRFSHIP